MSVTLKILLLLFSFLFLLIVFYFVKREKLSLRYSFLWLIAALVMILLVLLSKPIISLAALLGFEVASNMIFFGGFMILLAVTFSLSAIVSGQSEKISKLSQQVALLCYSEDKKDRTPVRTEDGEPGENAGTKKPGEKTEADGGGV